VATHIGTRQTGNIAYNYPRTLFSATEKGFWYDFSDASSLFQTSDRTVRVTAPGQPVALVLDKSGRSNHSFELVSLSRPVYGVQPVTGVRNVLTNTEVLSTQSVSVSSGTYTLSFSGAGSITLSGAASSSALLSGTHTFSVSSGSLLLSVSGTVTKAQLERQASKTQYQRVGATSFDVTEAGVYSIGYLFFNGLNSSLGTSAFSWNSPFATIVAGLRKQSDVSAGTLVEFSSQWNVSNGSFVVGAPGSPLPNYFSGARGSFGGTAANAPSRLYDPYSAPITNTLRATFNLAGNSYSSIFSFLVNSQTPTNITNLGSNIFTGTGGNFGTYELYLGARARTSLFFSGKLFNILGINRALTAIEAQTLDTWILSRTGE